MASEWKEGVLSDVADVVMGYSPPGETCNSVGTGVPLLNGPTEFEGHYPKPVQFTTEPRRFAEAGDLLFCVRGSTTGRMNWADQRYAIGRGIASIRPLQGPAFGPFVRALVEQALPRLLSAATGSTFPSVSGDQIKYIECLLPPLAEQKAIAGVLGALDDKIELNRRMNATLEAMARALFQSWFVDFDPVRAKLDGRQPAGLDKATAELFSDSFQDSPLGHIPKGWNVGRLDDALVLQRGFDLPATERTRGKYPVMAASGLNGCHDKFMVKGPGVTTGRSGVLGKVFFIHGDFWPLNTSLWVKEFKRVSPAYAFHLLRGLDFEIFNAGSAVPTLNRNHVHNLPIVIPPQPVVEAFDVHVMPLMKQQHANETQSRTLATLRDTLLPRLLSGELSVAAVTGVTA